jgi:hypothetical protein
MEANSDGTLELAPPAPSRTSSTTSKASRRSDHLRKSRKSSSAVSSTSVTPTTATSDKSLTSFPSLSPELNSPTSVKDGRQNANLSPYLNGETPKKSTKTKPSIVESLTAKSPSFRNRSALFEDSPTTSTQHVPGALLYASDDHIRRLITRVGAVALVRQFAEDIAQRDAELVAVRRRAEERERELKKMLREVEVSNLDIETRLHHLENNIEKDQKGKGGSGEGDLDSSVKRRGNSIGNGLDEIMGEAIKDDINDNAGIEEDYLATLNEHDKHATIRAISGVSRNADGTSTNSSVDTADKAAATTKGWKDYLWSGTGTSHRTSRASSIISDADETSALTRARAVSGLSSRRKGLNEALFQGPRRTSDIDEEAANSINSFENQKSRAASMTSWTLKLFAGNPHATREGDSQDTVRGRSLTGSNGNTNTSRNGSRVSVQTTSSAKASLMKVNSKSSGPQPLRNHFQPLNLGSTSTLKNSSQSTHSLPPGSPASVDTASNYGPVEMDTILPHGTRPPTLTPSYQNIDDPMDYLTDRFGFIYDQRRRRKEAEAFAKTHKPKGSISKEMLSNAKAPEANTDNELQLPGRSGTPVSIDDTEDRPAKKWQDYLKIATFPTELLSHTPTSGTFMKVANADIKASLKRSPTFEGLQEDAQALSPNPKPSASSVTASNAEIAKPVMTTPAGSKPATNNESAPVKLLLAQLTELHDTLQRDKTVKWNEFLRKIRAERRKEGETAHTIDSRSQQATMPEVSLADGEVIGIATLGSKGRTGRAKYKEFKSLVLAGIPVTLRPKVWAECSGASALRVPGYYDDLVNNGVDDPVILAQIQMDINRTLTDNVYFRKGPGVAKLNEVLLAYSRRNPEVGYCQGMNLITASLLLIMATAEDAFWILVSIIENILPRHYFDNSLLTSRADQQVLRSYVSELLPRLSSHLDDLGIELEALTFQWFLSLFTDCLSAEALYRVWDVLLCCKDEDGNGGSTFLFQVALALLKLNESQLVACATPGEVYTYLGGEMTNHQISIDGLIRASEGLKGLVRRTEVEDRRAKWVAFEKETIKERERIRKEVQDAKDTRSMKSDREIVQMVGSGTEELSEDEVQVISPMPIQE